MKFTQQREYEQAAQSDTPKVQPIYITGGGTAVVVIAMFLFSVIILYTTNQNEESAIAGVWGSVAFFLFGTPIGLLAVNGGISSMFASWQEQRTMRRLHQLQYDMQMARRISVVDSPQLPYHEPSTDPLPTLPITSTFVAPIAEPDDSARREAIAWLLQLYNKDGEPDPKKVLMTPKDERPGRLKIAAPGKDAKKFLLDAHVLHDLGTGYRLNLVRFPTIMAVRTQFGLTDGVGVVPHLDTPHHHPVIESGVAQ